MFLPALVLVCAVATADPWLGRSFVLKPMDAEERRANPVHLGLLRYNPADPGESLVDGMIHKAEVAGRVATIEAFLFERDGYRNYRVRVEGLPKPYRFAVKVGGTRFPDGVDRAVLDGLRRRLLGRPQWYRPGVDGLKYAPVTITEVAVVGDPQVVSRIRFTAAAGRAGHHDLLPAEPVDEVFLDADPRVANPWPPAIWELIERGLLARGMSEAQVVMAKGRPDAIRVLDAAGGPMKQLVYLPATYVYLQGDAVVTIQE